jgi:glutaredoxin
MSDRLISVGAVLYSRPNCPLCFTMKRSAGRIARRLRVPFQVVDITAHPELEELYRNEVPVLVLPGGHTFRGRADGASLLSEFEKAASLLTQSKEGGRRTGLASNAWDRVRDVLGHRRGRIP